MQKKDEMKISEAIEELQKILKEDGDLEFLGLRVKEKKADR